MSLRQQARFSVARRVSNVLSQRLVRRVVTRGDAYLSNPTYANGRALIGALLKWGSFSATHVFIETESDHIVAQEAVVATRARLQDALSDRIEDPEVFESSVFLDDFAIILEDCRMAVRLNDCLWQSSLEWDDLHLRALTVVGELWRLSTHRWDGAKRDSSTPLG